MKYVNAILSVVALLVAAAATAMTGGLWDVSPQMIGLTMTGGALLGVFGVQPFPVTDKLARAFSASSLFLAAVQAYHAQTVTAADNPHPWVWAIVGCGAVLLGVIGRSPVVRKAPAA